MASAARRMNEWQVIDRFTCITESEESERVRIGHWTLLHKSKLNSRLNRTFQWNGWPVLVNVTFINKGKCLQELTYSKYKITRTSHHYTSTLTKHWMSLLAIQNKENYPFALQKFLYFALHVFAFTLKYDWTLILHCKNMRTLCITIVPARFSANVCT